MYTPFFSDFSDLNEYQRFYLQHMSHTFKTKGIASFLVQYISIQKNPFFNDDCKNALLYVVRYELKIRYFAWKFVLKLKNKVFGSKPSQNEYLLDFTTPVSECKYPVYIFCKNKYWIFDCTEIKKIILCALRQNDMFEPQPKQPCNVYTNNELSPHQLMQIYLQIGHLKLHPLIHNHAKYYFDLKLFSFFHEKELQHDSTHTYVSCFNEQYIEELAPYFQENISHILLSKNIPLHMKQRVIRYIMTDEPLHNLRDIFITLYHIDIFTPYRRRRTRRAIRPSRRSVL
tara:strand:- start:1042 stop:1899 length:858 start_codon:yes stop_codon:yes gene_type:complete